MALGARLERTMPIRSRICSVQQQGLELLDLLMLQGKLTVQTSTPTHGQATMQVQICHTTGWALGAFAGAPGFISACAGGEVLPLPQRPPGVHIHEQPAMAHLVEDVCY